MSENEEEILSKRQHDVFNWIREYMAENLIAPTVREIGDAFDIKSSSVAYILKMLQAKGRIVRKSQKARGIEIAEGYELRKVDTLELPILGRIAAGAPLLAVEDATGSVVVDRKSLGGADGFALQIVGESMIEANIHDGDTVIIRKQNTANQGDIVVALIEGEATLKKFYRDGERYRLEPANKTMQPIYVEAGQFLIQGKAIAVQHNL